MIGSRLFASIGSPNVSITPVMYNAAFRERGLTHTYLSLEVTDLRIAIKDLRAGSFDGYSVSRPFKQAVVPLLDDLDPAARAIGAVNVVTRRHGILVGYNSDWVGAVRALREHTRLRGKRAAVLGAGGAARAIAYGLKAEGVRVAVYNRTREKARVLARDLGVSCGDGLHATDEMRSADLIVNATDVGSAYCAEQELSVSRALRARQVVLDSVFRPLHTRLLDAASAAGCIQVLGVEMLLYQGAMAFEIFSGCPAPIPTMLEALLSQLDNDPGSDTTTRLPRTAVAGRQSEP